MKKRIISMVLVIVIALTLCVPAVAATTTKSTSITYRGISIVINGEEIIPCDANRNTVEPFVMGGRTYLPLRAICQALGLNVQWDATTNTITLATGGEVITGDIPGTSSGTKQVDITYRDIKIVLNGKQLELEGAGGTMEEPFIMGGTTYLPIRIIGEALGLEVAWNGTTKTVIIKSTAHEEDNQPPVISCEIGKQYSTESGYGVKVLSAETSKVKGVNTFTFRYSLENLTSDQYLYEDTFTIGFTDGTSTNQGGIYLDGMYPGETLTKTYQLILNDKEVSYILFNDGDSYFFSPPKEDDLSTHLVWYFN